MPLQVNILTIKLGAKMFNNTKKSIIVLSTLFMMCLLISKPQAASLPAETKILKAPGILALKSIDDKKSGIGTAFKDYAYKVLDGQVAYYKISLPTGKTGWIYSYRKKNGTEIQEDGRVKILNDWGINVREQPYDSKSTPIGMAAAGFSFDVLDVEYAYLKVLLPNGKVGWIYTGKPEDRWVSYAKEQKAVESKQKGLFADFSNGKIAGTITVKTSQCDNNPQNDYSSYRLLMPEESNIEATFNSEKNSNKILEITHLSSKIEGSVFSVSPITITINDKDLMKSFDPGSHSFTTDKFNISKYLINGKNTIKIQYEKGNSHYWIKRLEIK
jgi:hypothetical protein